MGLVEMLGDAAAMPNLCGERQAHTAICISGRHLNVTTRNSSEFALSEPTRLVWTFTVRRHNETPYYLSGSNAFRVLFGPWPKKRSSN